MKDNNKVIIEYIEDYIKIDIPDYISVHELVSSTNDVNILSNLSNNVLWNNTNNKINKGTYYILIKDNILYNVLIKDNTYIIDTRTFYKDYNLNRFIYINNNNYSFGLLTLDKKGMIINKKYYSNYVEHNNLDKLSLEETTKNINELLNSLEVLNNIIDLELIKNILKDNQYTLTKK